MDKLFATAARGGQIWTVENGRNESVIQMLRNVKLYHSIILLLINTRKKVKFKKIYISRILFRIVQIVIEHNVVA